MRERVRKATPYLLLAPGILWLLFFFIIPTVQMFLTSVSSGTVSDGFKLTFTSQAYATAISKFGKQFGNSLLYGGAATILTFLIGFPMAYTIAFRGGRYKNLLLFLVIAPFFTSFLIRTISWKILLGDAGPLLGPLKELHILPEEPAPLHADRRRRRHHLQLPAVHGPAPLRRPREDRSAAHRGGQ